MNLELSSASYDSRSYGNGSYQFNFIQLFLIVLYACLPLLHTAFSVLAKARCD
jgi:hypothetical protein